MFVFGENDAKGDSCKVSQSPWSEYAQDGLSGNRKGRVPFPSWRSFHRGAKNLGVDVPDECCFPRISPPSVDFRGHFDNYGAIKRTYL